MIFGHQIIISLWYDCISHHFQLLVFIILFFHLKKNCVLQPGTPGHLHCNRSHGDSGLAGWLDGFLGGGEYTSTKQHPLAAKHGAESESG